MGSLFNCDFQDPHASGIITCDCLNNSNNSTNHKIKETEYNQTNENSKPNEGAYQEKTKQTINNHTQDQSSNRNSNRINETY